MISLYAPANKSVSQAVQLFLHRLSFPGCSIAVFANRQINLLVYFEISICEFGFANKANVSNLFLHFHIKLPAKLIKLLGFCVDVSFL